VKVCEGIGDSVSFGGSVDVSEGEMSVEVLSTLGEAVGLPLLKLQASVVIIRTIRKKNRFIFIFSFK
jgi:hypothetical protein